MAERTAILSNVFESAGPPALEALVAEGYHVLCSSAQFADAEARARFEASGPRRSAVADPEPEALAQAALDRSGRIDVAVSNDATDPRSGAFDERTAEDYRALLEAFAVMPCRLAMAALPAMKRQRAGRIILLTSAAGVKPSPGLVLYSAARAATNALVRSLAVEAAPFGVSVNAIAPLLFVSSFFPGGAEDPTLLAMVDEMIPMKRPGRPEEIGGLIGLLASGRADYVSGQVIAFAGGGA